MSGVAEWNKGIIRSSDMGLTASARLDPGRGKQKTLATDREYWSVARVMS